MSIKIDRIASNLVKEISYILMTEVKDPNVKFVTVTDCKVTNDLSYAKVYFTNLIDADREKVTKALNRASGFIRGKLFDMVEIRKMPELTFVYDESIEYGNKIEKRFREELSVVFQHEFDHLNGILFYDRIDKNNPYKNAKKYRAI